MKRTILFILVLSLPFIGHTQLDHDSLWSEWTNETRHDTARLNAFCMFYFDKYLHINADSALIYARQHWEYAAERGLTKYMAGGKNSIGMCHMTIGQLDSAMIYFKEAAILFDQVEDFGGAAAAIINNGIILANWGRNDEAIKTYKEGIELAEKAGNLEFKLNALNNTGVIYLNRGDYDNAIPTFEEVIAVAGKEFYGSDAHKGGYVNLGYALAKRGDHASAIDNFNACIKLMDEHGGGQVALYAYNFLGSSYMELGETENALLYFERSIAVADSLGDVAAAADPMSNIARIRLDQGRVDEARALYEEAYDRKLRTGHIAGSLQALGNLAGLDLEEGRLDSAAAKALRNLAQAREIGEVDQQASALTILGMAYIRMGRYGDAVSNLEEARSIALEIREPNLIKGAAEELSYAYKMLGRHKEALGMHEEFVLYRDSIERDGNKRAAIRQEFRYSYDKQALADSLDFAKKEAIKDLEIEKRDANLAKQRIGLAATGGGLLLLILLAVSIRRGKKRSDELLHNILPEEVATELKQKGKVGSKRIESVTVLFTDFKGFTAMAEQLSAKELVEDLNICFSEFDRIMGNYGIEKIKTIGDAYMAAGGLPIPDEKHAEHVIQAALEMRDFVEAGKAKKIEAGLPYFEIRIGVHTGPVVAGIVGVKKFQYDIWGDTVNTASRMESSGAVGQVNISEATYELVKDNSEFDFTSRGKIEAKGKGEMEMYFADRKTNI